VYVDPYRLAARFLGLKEAPGAVHNPAIVAMLDLCEPGPHGDEVPWCSAFVSYCCWLLGVSRSQSLRARSWLTVGAPIGLAEARPGYDVVVLARGDNAPRADVIAAPGHVGFFAGWDRQKQTVRVLGGNQGDKVSIAEFPSARVLGVRRLS